MSKNLFFLVVSFVLLFMPNQIEAQVPDGFGQEVVVTDLDPTRMVSAPDGRLFLTEKKRSSSNYP